MKELFAQTRAGAKGSTPPTMPPWPAALVVVEASGEPEVPEAAVREVEVEAAFELMALLNAAGG